MATAARSKAQGATVYSKWLHVQHSTYNWDEVGQGFAAARVGGQHVVPPFHDGRYR